MLHEEEIVKCAIFVKPKEEEDKLQVEVPKEVKQMLQEYKDIVSDGAPATLPVRRSISHQIDFVPGASLPNKAAYKLTLDQNKEVEREV